MRNGEERGEHEEREERGGKWRKREEREEREERGGKKRNGDEKRRI